MNNHSLTILLKSFSKEEVREFSEFLKSNYFNKRHAVTKLYLSIIKHYPDFNDTSFSKSKLFNEIFPGKEFNDSSFRVLISSLNELALKFVSMKHFETDLPVYNLNRIKALMQRDIYLGLDKIFSEGFSYLSESIHESAESFFHLHLYHSAKSVYLSEKHSGIFDKILDKANIEGSMENLILYFYSKFLSGLVNRLNIELLYNVKFKNELSEKIFQTIDKGIVNNHPVLEIYYNICLMLKDNLNDFYYYKIKNLFFINIKNLNRNDVVEIIINLQNFCSRKVSDGHVEFYKEKFELYKTELKLKTYIVKGKMSPVYYLSLVSLALKIKKMEWIRNFINKYSSELDYNIRNNIVNFASALYEFENNELSKSQDFLSKVKFTDVYQKLDAKILQIMVYYERDFQDSLIASLEAFRHFLSNNKLLTDKKINYYNNFTGSVRKLLYLKRKNENYYTLKFISELKSKKNFLNRNWIQKKAEDLLLKDV